ncbi:CPCC family cysteine-rich protein [Mucilaginibacter sp.]|uniref:CPCC family cysteine-rich protein n=1 Tax=Mucilaginibacter sp. TaxID=1882438 RepID=UPI00261259CF|nr:CPCC family cysteine-rich protein [Mucilaginibacter sp.]MDB4921283.1 hypothetical protein [Mucilaginibacter sp.]
MAQMILQRKEAITLSSFFKFLGHSEEERKTEIENALTEISLEPGDVAPEIANYHARKSIEYRFSFFTNSYLQAFLSKQLPTTIEVKGKGRKLLPCVCCGYKTLQGIGWEICAVCFWEDDGVTELNKMSGPNHMTLFEAKQNFNNFGLSRDGYQSYCDPDRMLQFEKSVMRHKVFNFDAADVQPATPFEDAVKYAGYLSKKSK